jgi:hypothetical protein
VREGAGRPSIETKYAACPEAYCARGYPDLRARRCQTRIHVRTKSSRSARRALAHSERRKGAGRLGLIIGVLVLLLLPATAWQLLPKLSWSSEETGPTMHRVERGELVHEISGRGSVESAENVEIKCEVKGHGAGTSILWVIPEGTCVEPVPDWEPDPDNPDEEPCGVLHWLENRRAAGKSTPGVYLCWELMVGNSNCRWHWVDKPDSPEPTIPWCGLMWPDATPVSLAEAEAVRRYVTGQSRAMFFDDFQDTPTLPSRPGWAAYGPAGPGESVYLPLEEPGMKMIAGDEQWTDYVLEGRVMLKGETGNAGLVLRVNAPGPGYDQMRAYYVGLDTRKLYLGKMENNWQPLAEFDLGKLDCRVQPDVWNLIRVAVEGPRIRVWLNRMHPSADSDRGLRIDFTDEEAPILSGAIGVRANRVSAWFDNIVVLPVDALPQSRSGKEDEL